MKLTDTVIWHSAAKQPAHKSTIICARSLYFTHITLTDTCKHWIFPLGAIMNLATIQWNTSKCDAQGANVITYGDPVCIYWFWIESHCQSWNRMRRVAHNRDLDNYPSCHCWDVSQTVGMSVQQPLWSRWYWQEWTMSAAAQFVNADTCCHDSWNLSDCEQLWRYPVLRNHDLATCHRDPGAQKLTKPSWHRTPVIWRSSQTIRKSDCWSNPCLQLHNLVTAGHPSRFI